MHVGRWLLPTEHQLIHTNQYMNIFSSTTDINRRLCLQNNEYVYLALTKKGMLDYFPRHMVAEVDQCLPNVGGGGGNRSFEE